jgi:hypothetical protein
MRTAWLECEIWVFDKVKTRSSVHLLIWYYFSIITAMSYALHPPPRLSVPRYRRPTANGPKATWTTSIVNHLLGQAVR